MDLKDCFIQTCRSFATYPSWELTYYLFPSRHTFVSMIFLFQRWDMDSFPWRVIKSSRNSGRDPYPTFWRRSPLRKNPVLLAGLFKNRNWFLAYQKREIQKHACYLASICNLFFFENEWSLVNIFFCPPKIYIDVFYLQLFWTSFMEL